MGRRSKRPPLPKGEQFVQLINDFRSEPAWRALSCTARVVYVEIKSLYNKQNNGRLMASVRWLADETGISKGAVEKALRDLQEHGFIVQMQGGYLGPEGKGQGTLWRLTEVGYLDERPTKDYRNWQPKSKSPSHEKGQGVPRDRTLPGDGVPFARTGCPTEWDTFGPKTGGACPTRWDDLQYARGDGEKRAAETVLPDDRTTSTRTRTTTSGTPTSSGSGELRCFAVISGGVIKRVGVRTDRAGHAPAIDVDRAFDEIWSVWPRTSKPRNARMKREARKAFDRAVARGIPPEELVAGVHAYRAQIGPAGLSRVQTKFPATWLREQQPSVAGAPVAQSR